MIFSTPEWSWAAIAVPTIPQLRDAALFPVALISFYESLLDGHPAHQYRLKNQAGDPSLMTPTEVAQFLISEYGLTRREALFTAKLVEGKSIGAASQEGSMTTGEARTAWNRVLLKVAGLFPLQVSHKVQVSNPAKHWLGEARLSRGQVTRV